MLVSFVTGYLIGQISVHCTTYFSALKVWKNKKIFRNVLFFKIVFGPEHNFFFKKDLVTTGIEFNSEDEEKFKIL